MDCVSPFYTSSTNVQQFHYEAGHSSTVNFFFYWGLEELLCSCLSLTTWKHVKKAVCTQRQEASGKSVHQISETAPAPSQLYNPIPPPKKKTCKQTNKKKNSTKHLVTIKKICLETRTLLSANPLLSNVF